MPTKRKPSQKKARRPLLRLAVALLLIAGVTGIAPRSTGDDRDLLRENTAEPFLFILLDTSMSMGLTLDGQWVPGNGDDPRSRLYLAREALYEALRTVPGVRFGFATFNQDHLNVTSKHFLYFVENAADPVSGVSANQAAINALGLGYPAVETDDETMSVDPLNPSSLSFDVDDGDLLTFGAPPAEVPGTCDNPLDLATEREKINRYPKLGIGGNTNTVIWIESLGETYFLQIEPDWGNLGDSQIGIEIDLHRVTNCAGTGRHGVDSNHIRREDLTLHIHQDFLMTDDGSGSVTFVDVGKSKANKLEDAVEATGGDWSLRDADGGFKCGDEKPFSGGGWEGNYDTGEPFSDNPGQTGPTTGKLEPKVPPNDLEEFDTFCLDPKDPATCQLLQHPTTTDSNFRAYDVGDLLPFSLTSDNKDAMLKRLNPNHKATPALTPFSFGSAGYFEDQPDPTLGRLRLRDPDNPPIVAAGISPIADAILDFRCWYTNSEHGGGKCSRSALDQVYDTGFMQILLQQDPATFNCRQPYLIVVSDLVTNCPGNSNVAQVAGFNSETKDKKAPAERGVSTWVLNLSGAAQGNPLSNAGKGEEIFVSTKQQLRDTLDAIVDIIQEDKRSFASAAVPSVQADVQNQIYITQFVPRKESSVWEGKVFAFAKPVPTTVEDGLTVPDTSKALWDGADKIMSQAPKTGAINTTPPSALAHSDYQIGGAKSDRRVIYPMAPIYTDPRSTVDTDKDGDPTNDLDALAVPRRTIPFGPVEDTATFKLRDVDGTVLAEEEVWADQIAGLFGVTIDPADLDSDAELDADSFVQAAVDVAKYHYEIKHVVPSDPTDPEVDYVLGDVFHATPQLVGSPRIGRFLNRPLDFPSYGEFFRAQERRRRVLFVAANDGQLHAFDAGQFGWVTEPDGIDDDLNGDPNDNDGDDAFQFSTGTGQEVFAYMPRALMPTVRDLAGNVPDHLWSMDGTLAGSDVFIDPIHEGRHSTNPPNSTQRSWRTVLVGGLRRGGNAYYALDVTTPDPMQTYWVEDPVSGTDVSQGWAPVPGSVAGPGGQDTDNLNWVSRCFAGGAKASGNPPPAPAPDDLVAKAALEGWHALCAEKLPYPAALWEFEDVDLGQTWSSPEIGAVKVLDAFGNEETRYVAIFGGGWDPGGLSSTSSVGDFLYMVDIETGRMIYKRFLDHSSSPGAPSAVDTDQDGFLDRIYIATTGNSTSAAATNVLTESNSGKIFRVDIREPVPIAEGRACDPNRIARRPQPRKYPTDPPRPARPFPTGVPWSTDACCNTQDHCITDPSWEPYAIYDSLGVLGGNTPVVPGTDKRFFFQPSVIFVSELGRFAVAAGTGNRENLWALEPAGPNGLTGEPEDGNRLFVFVDDSDTKKFLPDGTRNPDGGLDDGNAANYKDEVLRTEADFVDVTDPALPSRLDARQPLNGSDILEQADGKRGWYIRLGVAALTDENGVVFDPAHEKAIGPVTAISGINVASTFIPTLGSDSSLCARRGFSRSFAQFTSDGAPLQDLSAVVVDPNLPPPPPPPPCSGPDCRSRGSSKTLLSEPFIEQGGPCEGGEAMTQVLMDELFPPNCHFASYHFNLSSMRADTGVECLAQVPVCISEHNWKDH